MRLFKSYTEEYAEAVAYGFELAIRYAELASKYDKPIIPFLEEELPNIKKVKL